MDQVDGHLDGNRRLLIAFFAAVQSGQWTVTYGRTAVAQLAQSS